MMSCVSMTDFHKQQAIKGHPEEQNDTRQRMPFHLFSSPKLSECKLCVTFRHVQQKSVIDCLIEELAQLWNFWILFNPEVHYSGTHICFDVENWLSILNGL